MKTRFNISPGVFFAGDSLEKCYKSFKFDIMPKSKNKRKNGKKTKPYSKLRKLKENRQRNEYRDFVKAGVPLMLMYEKFNCL